MPTLKDLVSLTQSYIRYIAKSPPDTQQATFTSLKDLVLKDERLSPQDQALEVLALNLAWEVGLGHPALRLASEPARDILERNLGMKVGTVGAVREIISSTLQQAPGSKGPSPSVQ